MIVYQIEASDNNGPPIYTYRASKREATTMAIQTFKDTGGPLVIVLRKLTLKDRPWARMALSCLNVHSQNPGQCRWVDCGVSMLLETEEIRRWER